MPESMTEAPSAAVSNEVQRVIDAMDELKAIDIRELDVSGVAGFTDHMVFASGRSNRHVKAIAQAVVEAEKEAGNPPLGIEGEAIGEWVLVDLGDIVVHVMLPETRAFYDIERLWQDQLGLDAD